MYRLIAWTEKKIEGSVFLKYLNEIDKEHRILITLCYLICCTIFIGILLAYCNEKSQEIIFTAITTLFNGLAFAGIFYTMIMQKHELSLQREQINKHTVIMEQTMQATLKQAEIDETTLRLETIAKIKNYNEIYINNYHEMFPPQDQDYGPDDPYDAYAQFSSEERTAMYREKQRRLLENITLSKEIFDILKRIQISSTLNS